jgi:F0F1-type ATP synthase membrane subunit b/b'
MDKTHTRIFIKKPSATVLAKLMNNKSVRIQQGNYPFPVLNKIAKKFNKLKDGKSLTHTFSNDEINYAHTMAGKDDANIEGGSIFGKKIDKWFKKTGISSAVHTLTKVILPIVKTAGDAGLIALSIIQPEIGIPLAAGIKTLEKVMDGVTDGVDVINEVKQNVKDIKNEGKKVKKIVVKKTKTVKAIKKEISTAVANKNKKTKETISNIIHTGKKDVAEKVSKKAKKIKKDIVDKVQEPAKELVKEIVKDPEELIDDVVGDGLNLSGSGIKPSAVIIEGIRIKDKLLRRHVEHKLKAGGIYLTSSKGRGLSKKSIQLGGFPILNNKINLGNGIWLS